MKAFKQKILPLMVFISGILMSIPLSAQDFVKASESVAISLSDIKTHGYGTGSYNATNPSKQPINSKDDAWYFLDGIKSKLTNGALSGEVNKFIDELNPLSGKARIPRNKKTIVFVHHPLDVKYLAPDNTTNRDQAENEFKALCRRKTSLDLFLKELDEKFQTDITSTTPPNPMQVKALKKSTSLNNTDISEVNNQLQTRSAIYAEIEKINQEMTVALANYKNNRSQFKELDKVEHYLLHRENGVYTDYLLNSNQILLVVLGGSSDLQNMKVQINNKPNRLEQSFNDLIELVTAMNILPKTGSFSAGENLCDFNKQNNVKDTLKCTFILLEQKEIKPPAEITFAHDSIDDIKLEIHEKSYAQFLVGVSASSLERKQFVLNDNNELTVMTDSAQAEEWRGNAMVMIDFYPWGRDMDRLEPIWKRQTSQKFGAYFLQRFGISAGLRLSKDPLETIFLGGSFAASRELTLNFGLAFQSTPIDQTDLPVGPDATLEYLQDNVGREYKPRFFIGVAFSPSGFAKNIKLNKDE